MICNIEFYLTSENLEKQTRDFRKDFVHAKYYT